MSPGKKLEIERFEREDQKAVVFRLSGTLTDTKECYAFLEDARAEVKRGLKHVILNLKGVEHVSSCGVGILAAIYTSVHNAGGRLCVAAVSEEARLLLELVGLWKILEHCSTEEEALAIEG